MTDNLLVFHLGGHRYALPSSAVREVVRAVAVVPLPKAPAIVEGIIDYRGSVAPVLDIRARFGLAPIALDVHQHFVLAEAQRLVALRVDRVSQVIEGVTPEALESATPYVSGVVKLKDGLVLIHDLATFLSAGEQVAIEEALG